MPLQHASDLSPAQRLLQEISDLPCCPDLSLTMTPAQELECENTEIKSMCREYALKQLFSLALRWCELHTGPLSWQRRRLYALLGPMYLEAATLLNPTSSPHELLRVYPTWTNHSTLPCAMYHQVLMRSLEELKDLLAEMITEVSVD